MIGGLFESTKMTALASSHRSYSSDWAPGRKQNCSGASKTLLGSVSRGLASGIPTLFA